MIIDLVEAIFFFDVVAELLVEFIYLFAENCLDDLRRFKSVFELRKGRQQLFTAVPLHDEFNDQRIAEGNDHSPLGRENAQKREQRAVGHRSQ